MMVRALRAFDLEANSELAICSRASEAGGLALATVLGPLVDTWVTGNGGAAEFATGVSGFRIYTPTPWRRAGNRWVDASHCVGERLALPGCPHVVG